MQTILALHNWTSFQVTFDDNGEIVSTTPECKYQPEKLADIAKKNLACLIAAKPKIGQIAMYGPHTDEIGRVTAIRNGGFYVRVKKDSGYRSVFFTNDRIGTNGFDHTGNVTLCD
jgi:hypothetical protein